MPSLSRRRFLRGTGVALGLPWFESISAFGAEAAKPGGAPRRLAVCFTGNGVNPHHWGAKMGANGIEFANSLRPLIPMKDKVAVFTGLWNPTTVEGEGGHYPKMNVLSGLRVKKTTTDVEVGTTMDQIISAKVGRETPVPSIVLGTERPSYATDSGFTSIYSAYISWSTPTTPAPKEIFPQQAFDQLFDDGSKRQCDKSILDLVLDDAKGLRSRLSVRDSQKLDEYLASVRDILLLAFQMDRTRVATFMLNNDLSNMRFPSLEGVTSGIHELSHHAGDETRLAHYQKVNEFQVKLWAEFLQKMAATNEGERSLLDNSMILLTSSLMDGNAHDSRQLPVVLAGGGGGTIKGGQAYDLSRDPNRKLCRLHLALMDRMGVRVDKFGDAENALVI
jgi:hypothetical protein